MPSPPLSGNPSRLMQHWARQAEGERRWALARTDRQRTWPRIAVIGTALIGIVATGWVLRLPAGDARFFPATGILGLIWFGGALLGFRLGAERIPGPMPKVRALALGIGCGLGLLLVFVLGALVVSRVPMLRDPVLALIAHAGQGYLPLAITATAVNAVAEECFFRGALFQSFGGRAAVLGSTAVYTIPAAASGIALLALAAVLLGLLTAVLRRFTGGITAPASAHVVWSLGMLLLLPLLLTN